MFPASILQRLWHAARAKDKYLSDRGAASSWAALAPDVTAVIYSLHQPPPTASVGLRREAERRSQEATAAVSPSHVSFSGT